jgi:hypothetical protein
MDSIPFYFVYNINENLNEANPFMSAQDIAFAVKKESGLEDNYIVYERAFAKAVPFLIIYFTSIDPRDTLKDAKEEDFHMFELTSLAPSRTIEANIESILRNCVSREDWPENVLAELEINGFLSAEEREQAAANRRSSANALYNRPHSQTNGA